MAVTNYSPLLGLALPTTGDLSGTWGTTVNDSITSLLDSAVAGTTTLSSDADVTLSTTNGAANQARNSIILWTAAGTVTRYITAPAQSKAYVVINTSSTQAIVIRGAGPTTGVTVNASKQALVAWNGSDFVKISDSVINTDNTWTGTQTFNGTSASEAMVVANIAETTTVSASSATGTVTMYPSSQSVLYLTSNASGNWVFNLAWSSGTSMNAAMSTGQSVTVAALVTQGGTPYYNTSVTVDGTGTGVTTKWQGGAPIAGNAGGIDVYTYTVIKTGSAAFTVLASQTQFV